MLSAAAMVLPQGAVDEVKAYLRLVPADEDALVRACLETAAELCERFTGQALIMRAHEERLAGGGGWLRLSAGPVAAITGVESVAANGSASALAASAYQVDIDVEGQGWVRLGSGVGGSAGGRVRVTYQAGMAAGWDGLPEALRHGIVRLAAHLFMRGEDAGAAPPAAVSVLWRPWRRMQIGGGHVRAG